MFFLETDGNRKRRYFLRLKQYVCKYCMISQCGHGWLTTSSCRTKTYRFVLQITQSTIQECSFSFLLGFTIRILHSRCLHAYARTCLDTQPSTLRTDQCAPFSFPYLVSSKYLKASFLLNEQVTNHA